MAALCRISLSPQEVDFLREELSDVLEHVRALQEVDTEGVPPTSHSVGLSAVMRDDTPSEGMDRESALGNAPRREGDYFRVNVVLDE